MIMRDIPFLYRVFFLICAFVASPCYAAQDTDEPDLGGFIPGEKWKEGNVIIPAFPQSDDLLKVEVDRADMPFNFYIDSKNISVSNDDGITRYTVVLESNSGAKNVLFEGIRCQTAEFRTYAYGTYDNKLVKARTSKWERIQNNGYMVHRYDFFRHYMCNERQTPNPVREVLQKIEYPEDFQGTGEISD